MATAFAPRAARADSWPFDQRNILLAKTEGRDFPDDLTVAQILDIFVKKGRVRWVTEKAGAGQILPVVVPKDFQWQSTYTVKSLGLRYKVDGIVLLHQKGTELDLRWYSTSDGQPLFFEKVNLPKAGPSKEENEMRRKRLANWLEDIWLRIPGRGYVVKRDLTTVSFEGASQTGVKVGDRLELRRLEQAQRHPLLRTLIGIHSTLSGTATVTTVADPFSTAKIIYESSTDPIQEGDRYEVKSAETAAPSPEPQSPTAPKEESKDPNGRILLPLNGDSPRPAPEQAAAEKKSDDDDDDDDVAVADEVPKYRLFDITGRLGLTKVSHIDNNADGTASEIDGSGPSFDLKARGYITHNWVADLSFGLRHYSAGGLDPNVFQVSSVTGDIFMFRLSGAYRFIFMEDPYAPGEFDVGAGYEHYSFSVSQTTSNVAPEGKAFSALDFSLWVKVPVYEKIALFAGGIRSLGASFSESPQTSGVGTGSVLWQFEFGGSYYISQAAYVSAGIATESATSTFSGAQAQRPTAALSNSISTTNFFGAYTRKF